MDFFKKYHKWLGIVVTLFIVLLSVSGIILNHREAFSGTDVSRNILPDDYAYNNWNNGAVKSTLKISPDSVLIYGNAGIWLTDSMFTYFTNYTDGFPGGVDNKKIYKLFKTKNKTLLAGTLFGLYRYNNKQWEKIKFTNKPVVDIAQKQDTVLILTRSFLYKTTDFKSFVKITVPPPINYNNKVGLFKTLWVIHSGEIYGKAGVVFTDIIGVVFLFLSITGIIYWLAPRAIKKGKKKEKKVKRKVIASRWSLKWHNKIGWIFTLFLIISTLTGMFLRPPLLIAIADSEVNKIPHSELDTPNAWFDKLRRVIYDKQNNRYIFGTIDGFFTTDSSLNNKLIYPAKQPPISIMGINVFKQLDSHLFMIGSFKGLFIYDEITGDVFDYIKKQQYIPVVNYGRPFGTFFVAGYTNDLAGNEYFFDFNQGIISLAGNKQFPNMPLEIKEMHMSLWNVALEFHTMRIWRALIGNFYVLLIPLIGLSTLFIIISGFVVWYKKYRK